MIIDNMHKNLARFGLVVFMLYTTMEVDIEIFIAILGILLKSQLLIIFC